MSHQVQNDSTEREVTCVIENLKLYAKGVGQLQLGFQNVPP